MLEERLAELEEAEAELLEPELEDLELELELEGRELGDLLWLLPDRAELSGHLSLLLVGGLGLLRCFSA